MRLIIYLNLNLIIKEKIKKGITLEQKRVKLFYDEIQKEDIIDVDNLRKLSCQGMPTINRPIYWKILLNYLPTNKSKWEEVLEQKRNEYKEWIKDLLPQTLCEIEDTVESYETYYEDTLINDVNKDIKRTYDQFLPEKNTDNIVVNSSHCKSIRRILILWAKLHPNVNYVQGMNEVLRPIYYVFASDEDENFRKYAECDTFFCFTNLMIEIIYNFCQNLDHSDIGIFSKMNQMDDMLKKKKRY